MAQLGIQPDGASGSDVEEEAGTGDEQDDVKIYHSGQLTSTVTVTAIHNSDRHVAALNLASCFVGPTWGPHSSMVKWRYAVEVH